MKYANIREQELVNKIAQDYFWKYDCTKMIGNVDFCVSMHQTPHELLEQESLLWAEAKKGSSDIYTSLVQLILTIGKARTFDKYLPPAMLGAFDGEKIAFVPYNDIHEVFYINDFNWNVTPSNHQTKEFKSILEKVRTIIDTKTLLFEFIKDDRELTKFIKNNFIVGKFGITKTKIDKNNFISIFNKWLIEVKPSIAVNWDFAQKIGIISGDFYLADLLSEENITIKEKLSVWLRGNHYMLDRKIDEAGFFNSKTSEFNDKQVAHTQFWNRYERPPKEEYWDYIVERRDLLVPQDIRERKGSYFTPPQWVELSQKYLADVLGENWQDEYYIWDCAAGTGNLLAGLTNKYNIWASTLDKQDVEVMHDRINNGANLLDEHVFQFDFLNDDFSKLPKPLQDIINNPQKRKKLVIYINPPYAEHGNSQSRSGKIAKSGVAKNTKTYEYFSEIVGTGTRELFAQFFLRIYRDLPDAILASFSTLKYINSQNFEKFRNYFNAEFKKGFICRADSFDNVKGKFPIGFLIWDLNKKNKIEKISVDIVDNDTKSFKEIKSFYSFEKKQFISNWLRNYYDIKNECIGFLILPGVDMQAQNGVYITSIPTKSDIIQHKNTKISRKNLIQTAIYFSVRHCIEATWLNDRDQFLYPNEGWKTDREFQTDCLAYTLFHGQNRISSKEGINHWIPFTEQEVNAKEKFESNFMSNFIKGKKITDQQNENLFTVNEPEATYEIPLFFSTQAKAVFEAGLQLWKYYHQSINVPSTLGKAGEGNVNASLYDIREYFQGRSEKGKMNNKSSDTTYTNLMTNLRDQLKKLAQKIEEKVYEYEFLKV